MVDVMAQSKPLADELGKTMERLKAEKISRADTILKAEKTSKSEKVGGD